MLDDNCTGCGRTFEQMLDWTKYSEDDRMRIMRDLKKSSCPKCGVNNNCALEVGKSINSCWCFGFDPIPQDKEYDSCLCRSCLTK